MIDHGAPGNGLEYFRKPGMHALSHACSKNDYVHLIFTKRQKPAVRPEDEQNCRRSGPASRSRFHVVAIRLLHSPA